MSAFYRKRRSHVDLTLQDARGATAHGGQLIVDALAKDFGLWDKIRACGCMDPRKDKSRGFSPEAIVSQMIFSCCSGGICLADAGRLSEDKALGQLVGMEHWADESTLGEWLRAQNTESLKALWAIIREFIAWALPKAKPGRARHGGQLEVFFDDTQIEVGGHHHLKGAKEHEFHQILGHMILHHPPCLSNEANAFYYGLGALAFNLLMAVKVLLLEDQHQAWSARTLIRFWLTVPVKIARHAHRTQARIFIPKAALRWWRLFLADHYPKRKPGRPPKEPDLVVVGS